MCLKGLIKNHRYQLVQTNYDITLCDIPFFHDVSYDCHSLMFIEIGPEKAVL